MALQTPGAPELHDLIDLNIALHESGLIEEEEMQDDSFVASFRVSAEAIARSASAVHHDKMGMDGGNLNHHDDHGGGNASLNDQGTVY